MEKKAAAHHLDAAGFRYYEGLSLPKSSLTENGDLISAVPICTPTAADSEMERVHYAMVKKDVMSIKSFYTTLQNNTVCHFWQFFDICFSVLVRRC